MGSSRLPGKVLKEICGMPMLYWAAARAAQAKSVDEMIIATTIDSADDPIAEWALGNGIECFRGSVFDVLDRYYQAAKFYQAGIIVRLTADCPLIDPELIDELITAFQTKGADFAANRLPPPYKRTYPIGLDIEIASFSALEIAWQKAQKPFEREHVMPFLYMVKDRFSTLILDAEEDYGSRRWTVDTQQDLEFIREVYNKLNCSLHFTWRDVLAILDENPELEMINADIHHKSFLDTDGRANSLPNGDKE